MRKFAARVLRRYIGMHVRNDGNPREVRAIKICINNCLRGYIIISKHPSIYIMIRLFLYCDLVIYSLYITPRRLEKIV